MKKRIFGKYVEQNYPKKKDEDDYARETVVRVERKELAPSLPQKVPTDSIGVLRVGDRKLDLDALAKRVRRKGSTNYQQALAKAFLEVPPEFENGVPLTVKQISRMFDVTVMTIYAWRKKYHLPCYELSGGKHPPVRYDEGLVKEWARLHGKRVMREDYLDWC